MTAHDLDKKLKLHVDDEHRVVVIGTPDGLAGMCDGEILALLRRLSELREQFRAAGYFVTHPAAEHPKWNPSNQRRT
jgi:hypothetical protein